MDVASLDHCTPSPGFTRTGLGHPILDRSRCEISTGGDGQIFTSNLIDHGRYRKHRQANCECNAHCRRMPCPEAGAVSEGNSAQASPQSCKTEAPSCCVPSSRVLATPHAAQLRAFAGPHWLCWSRLLSC